MYFISKTSIRKGIFYMALGTMVSCAEYYQDTTTYTGDAGSATNPYAVEDCYDFCNILYAGYYNFVKDIDFNEL